MNKIPRGYTITPKVKYLRGKDKKTRTTLFELTHKRRGINKLFASEEYAIRYIGLLEADKVEAKALDVRGYQHVKGVVSAHKDAVASVELAEIASELKY